VGAVLVAGAIGGCGSSGDNGVSDKTHDEFVAGCRQGGQRLNGCECLYTDLTKKQGLDTEDELTKLNDQVQAAVRSSNPAGAIPDAFRKALLACKDKLQG
jgi:hypothetical protein